MLLARLFVAASAGESLAALARTLAADPASVQREVTRLEEAGIVTSERIGNTRIVRPDTNSPIYGELRALLTKSFGPAPMLEARLAGVRGVEKAFIFGSWARRFRGEPGPLPRDIDVLVVGDADPDEVYRATREVEDELGIEVNPVVVAEPELSARGGFGGRVLSGPVVELFERTRR
jgi:predicted nucleotidyltransferase